MLFCAVPSQMIQLFNQPRFLLTHLKYILFLGLKANFSKCETAGTGSMKGVLEAVCSLKSIYLPLIETIKILGVHFSYNATLKVQNNFLDTSASFME